MSVLKQMVPVIGCMVTSKNNGFLFVCLFVCFVPETCERDSVGGEMAFVYVIKNLKIRVS